MGLSVNVLRCFPASTVRHCTARHRTPQGSYRTPNELWIVMEYCGGGSVSDLIAASGEPLPEELIAHICGEALKVGARGCSGVHDC